MPKTYRDRPLPKIDDRHGLPILDERAERTGRALGRYVSRLDPDFIMEAAQEIGLDECIRYNKKRTGLIFDLTNLQAVALTAALAALVELRDSAGI